MSIPKQNTIESEHLAAAQSGDPQHFAELSDPYRRELLVHCYRILGSLHESEDMVQETMLKAWKHIRNFEGRASFRSWLYKIATNTSLDHLDSKRSRRLLPSQTLPASNPDEQISPPPPEMTWLEPFPDEWLEDKSAPNPEARYSDRESISFAFLAALQSLPPRQRAVLILRDVLDFSAKETAEILEITLSSANSALHRARATLARRYHGRDSETPHPPFSDEKTQWLLDHFVEAWESADVDGLVALLKEDATFSMPPSPSWYRGRTAIGVFVAATVFAEQGMFGGRAGGRWTLKRTSANAAPAFAIYQHTETDGYQPFGILALTIKKGKLSEIISFIDPALPGLFGIP